MSSKCHSAAVAGVTARFVEVEVSLRGGSPKFVIVGLPDAAVRESRDRVRTAIQAAGYSFPGDRTVLVNLAPASRRKFGPVYDLPIALGILAADGILSPKLLARHFVLGELALDGRVRSIRGALPIALRIARTRRPRLLLPAANAAEAALVPDLEMYPVRELTQAVAHLSLGPSIPPLHVDPSQILATPPPCAVDLSDVRGQTMAKRALLVAAAGGHNLLML